MASLYLFTGWVYERMSIDEYKTMIHELWVRLGLPLAYYEMRRDSITRDCLSRINTKILHPDNSRVVFENGVFDLDTKRFYKEVDKSTVQLSVMPTTSTIQPYALIGTCSWIAFC